jgi:HKD family nuclease
MIAQVVANRFFPLKYIFEIYLVFASIGLWKCLNRTNREWNLKTNQQFNKDIRSNFSQAFLLIFLKLIIIVNFSLYIIKVYYWWDLMTGKL